MEGTLTGKLRVKRKSRPQTKVGWFRQWKL